MNLLVKDGEKKWDSDPFWTHNASQEKKLFWTVMFPIGAHQSSFQAKAPWRETPHGPQGWSSCAASEKQVAGLLASVARSLPYFTFHILINHNSTLNIIVFSSHSYVGFKTEGKIALMLLSTPFPKKTQNYSNKNHSITACFTFNSLRHQLKLIVSILRVGTKSST